MLKEVFETVFHMSLVGSYIVLIVLAVRFCLIKLKSSRKYTYYLWFVVFINLCLPISIKGSISLIPLQISQFSVQTIIGASSDANVIIHKENDSVQQETGDSDKQIGPANIQPSYAETGNSPAIEQTEDSVAPGYTVNNGKFTNIVFWQHAVSFAGWVWLCGVLTIALRNLYCGLCLKKHLESSRHAATDIHGKLYFAKGITSPILWGIINPTVYLPFDVEDDEKEYLIAHELHHKKRRDYLAKPAAFCITALHWFNPLAWAAYALFCRDMEISCDEAVLAASKEDIRKRYAAALLKYAARQNGYALTPLTFGEPSLRSRIKNVLQYKKRGTAVSITAIMCTVLVMAGLMLHPQPQDTPPSPGEEEIPSEILSSPDGQINSAANGQTPKKDIDENRNPDSTEIPVSQSTGTPASAEGMVPDITIGPMDTITALPMGTAAEVDLDGDGVAEFLRVSALDENGKDAVSHQELYGLLPMIQVDSSLFTPNMLRNLGLYVADLDIATYYVFDLDTTDSYKEIGVYFEGYTVSPRTFLLRYKNGILTCIGCLEDVFPISASQTHTAESWALELSTNPDADYQEMLDSVNRSELQLSVPGDGSITAMGYVDYAYSLQDAFTWRTWRLVNPEDFHTELEECKLEIYEFEGWNEDKGELAVTTVTELQVYAAPSAEAEVITLPAGTKVAFCRYYTDGCWMQMAYGGFEEFGYFQYKKPETESNSGLFSAYRIITPGGIYDRDEIFYGLYWAAGR